jgi:hypothetical protein
MGLKEQDVCIQSPGVHYQVQTPIKALKTIKVQAVVTNRSSQKSLGFSLFSVKILKLLSIIEIKYMYNIPTDK